MNATTQPNGAAPPNSGPDERWQKILAHLAVLLFLCAFFWKSLSGQGVFYGFGHTSIFLPIHIENSELRQQGEWPLWNRHCFLGFPTQAEHELNGLYAATLIFDVIPDHGRAYTYYVFLHYVLAAFSMMYLTRRLGAGSVGQAAAGIAYACGGTMVGMLVSVTLVIPFAWAPLVVALLLKAYDTLRLLDIVLAGLAIAVQAMSAHPGGGVYMCYVLGVMIAFQKRGPHGWRRLATSLGVTAAAGAVALALTAPALLYFLQIMLRTNRVEGFGAKELFFYSLPPQHLFELLVPDFFINGRPGYFLGGEERVYFGLIGLPLLLLGWNHPQENRNVFRALTVTGLILSLGRFGGLYRLLVMVPGFASMHGPQRMLLVATLGACPLIGLGVDRLARGELNIEPFRKRSLAFMGAVAGSLGLMWLLMDFLRNDVWTFALHRDFGAMLRWPGEEYAFGMSPMQMYAAYGGTITAVRNAVILAAGGTAFFYGLGKFWQKRTAAWLATGWLAIEMFVCNSPIVDTLNPPDFYDQQPKIARLWKESPELCRVYATMDDRGLRQPNLGLVQRNMAAILGIDAFNFDAAAAQTELITLTGQMSKKHQALYNVKYHMVPTNPVDLVLSPQERHGKWKIEEIKDFVPRITVRDDVHVIPDPVAAVKFIDTPEFSLEESVVLDREPEYVPGAATEEHPAEPVITNLDYHAQHVELDVTLSQPGILVLSDLYYPGWQAFTNDRPIEILRANALTRGLPLGPGTHHILFRYHPRMFYLGLRIAGVAGLLVAIYLAGVGLRYLVARRRSKVAAA